MFYGAHRFALRLRRADRKAISDVLDASRDFTVVLVHSESRSRTVSASSASPVREERLKRMEPGS